MRARFLRLQQQFSYCPERMDVAWQFYKTASWHAQRDFPSSFFHQRYIPEYRCLTFCLPFLRLQEDRCSVLYWFVYREAFQLLGRSWADIRYVGLFDILSSGRETFSGFTGSHFHEVPGGDAHDRDDDIPDTYPGKPREGIFAEHSAEDDEVENPVDYESCRTEDYSSPEEVFRFGPEVPDDHQRSGDRPGDDHYRFEEEDVDGEDVFIVE